MNTFVFSIIGRAASLRSTVVLHEVLFRSRGSDLVEDHSGASLGKSWAARPRRFIFLLGRRV